MTREPTPTNQFRRDLKKAKKRKIDLASLESIIEKICNRGENQFLPTQHRLVGNYSNCWELHIKNDYLLIWTETETTVTLLRLGRHTDLFDD